MVSNTRIQKVLSVMIALLLVLVSIPAMASEESAETPVVVIYQNSGKISAEAKNSSTDEALTAVHQAILDATGVDVQVIVPVTGTETERLNLLLGSNTQIDLFWGNWQTYKDIAMPLNDLLENYGQDILARIDDATWKVVTDSDGTIYGIPRNYNMTPYATWIRTDWMEEQGLEWPTTIDEYTEVLRAMKVAYPDAWPLVTGPQLYRTLYCFLGGFVDGGYGNWLDESDGLLKPYYLADGYKDFLTWMNMLYTEGLMYPESFTVDTTTIREQLKQNKAASMATWYSSITLQTPYLQQNYPDADYDWIKGFSGDAGLCETAYAAAANALIIPKTAKNAEAMMKVLNWTLADKTNFMIGDYGIEGVNWQWADEENGVFDVLSTDYIGEYVMGEGPMDKTIMPNNAMQLKHYEYIHNESWHIEYAKMPYDFGVLYDETAFVDNVPTYSDLLRLVEEESIHFIMGERDLSEYDDFIQELYDMGVEDYITELNAQYQALTN